MNGPLTFDDYKYLIANRNLVGINNETSQIQPSSIDLTLSEECYEIQNSFLSPNKNLREKLSEINSKKIDFEKKKIFKKNKTYIVRLNEKLSLNKNIRGLCNPKSSTGRLDIFCRTIF